MYISTLIAKAVTRLPQAKSQMEFLRAHCVCAGVSPRDRRFTFTMEDGSAVQVIVLPGTTRFVALPPSIV